MNSEDEIERENLNRNVDMVVSVNANSASRSAANRHRNIENEEDSELHCNESRRPNENSNTFVHLKQQAYSYITTFQDWWICTSVITKVKVLGFLVLPCLAIGLYIFHYTKHPGSLHNPIAVLHPLSVVHPVIPSPFHSSVKFIEEKTKELLFSSVDVSVTTKKGPVVGRRFDPNSVTGASYDAFLGIPYGHIPARFQRAEPSSPWPSPRQAQSNGPLCPQPGVDEDYDEDCLFINVFTPKAAAASSASYPVIVYIHGQDFTSGSGSSEVFGPDFLVPKGVILVTFNYRLGAAGFLTLGSRDAPGNAGLWDTHLALRWVQDEIGGFGGDPAQVTVMGQGAGAVLALYHYLAPASAGLFRYVIAQSGSALADWGHYSAVEGSARARSLAAAVGCGYSSNDTQLLVCLQQQNISDIVGNQSVPLSTQYKVSGQTMVFLPVLDTDFAEKPFFDDSPSNLLDKMVNKNKPLILGFTADEGIIKFAEEESWKMVEANLDYFIPPTVAYSLRRRRKAALVNAIRSRYFRDSISDSKIMDIVRIYGDHMMAYPVLQMTRKLANSSYGYIFDFSGPWTPDPPYIAKFHVSGVNHGFDLRYLFYSSDDPQDLGNCSTLRESLKVRDAMVNWWTNFVKSGSPGGNWPTISGGSYMKINANSSLVDSATVENDHNFNFWASLETMETAEQVSCASFAKLDFIVILVVLWCTIFNTSSQ